MPLISKQKVSKAKEVVMVKLKENVKEKEKAPSQVNAKRKTTEPSIEGF